MADSLAKYHSLQHWDLAPGEPISQSPPIRALQGSQVLRCPAPTLDTQEFNIHHASSCEDGSSMDSLAEFDLAPGEARSQCPSRERFQGSQCPPCPPPTLDTQEFEKNDRESEDVWKVEDSLGCYELAPGEPRSEGPILDLHNTPSQLSPLDTQEFKNNRVISEDVWRVEDSQSCWDSTPDEATQERSVEHLSDSKSQLVPSLLINASGPNFAGCLAGYRNQEVALVSTLSTSKRSLQPTSAWGDSMEKPTKQVKFDSGVSELAECCTPPLQLKAGRPSSNEEQENVSLPREDNLELAKGENLGIVSSSPSIQVLPTAAVPRSLSLREEIANNEENKSWRTPALRRCALADVTNLKALEARSANEHNSSPIGRTIDQSTKCYRTSPIKGDFVVKREDASNTHEALMSSCDRAVALTNHRRQPSSENGNVSNGNGLNKCTRSTEMDCSRPGQKTGCLGQAKGKGQTLLNYHSLISSKSLEHCRLRTLDEWRNPKDGKKFCPTSKQLSLDRWLT